MNFIQLFIIIYIIAFTFQQNDVLSPFTDPNSDASKCYASSTSSCKKVKVKSKKLECCKISTNFYGGSINGMSVNMCFIFSKQKITQSDIEAAQKTYREVMGFTTILIQNNYGTNYMPQAFSSMVQAYDCPSQSFSINYKSGNYTNEEINVFKSENYCLRLYYKGLADMDLLSSNLFGFGDSKITKNDCSNGIVLPSSADTTTCAYASLKFKLIDGSSETLTTCFLISKNSFKTKALDKHLEDSFQTYTNVDGIKIESYEIEITDKNNNVLKYDSKTQTLSKSSFINISKILLFSIFLCLF